jgi:transposase
MPMVAEEVDAVVGGDTHKDSHTLEIVAAGSVSLAAITVSNDEGGYAQAIAGIVEQAPGPRIIVGLEGTRSYGLGLARALTRAGVSVVEVERPKREQRRGKASPARSMPISRRWRHCG